MIRWTDESAPGRPYWWEGQKDIPDLSCNNLSEKCDVLIIGAGYTGLSAAIAADDAGARVIVVDATVPGQGASTRNGGMFGAHPRLGWTALAKAFGPDTADEIFAEATPALTFTKGLIHTHGIRCDLQETGRIQLAWTRQHFAAQRQLSKDVREKSDVEVQILSRDELDREIGTDQYFGGVVFPRHCALHPRKFHQGLLSAVVGRDIMVVSDCPVTDLNRDGTGFVAQTPAGPISADKVVLATNGYTTNTFRWHQGRVFPLPSYLIATEELSPDLIAQLAPGRRMMVETRARHSYFRVSPDGKRILFGGRASMRNMPLPKAAERLHATMCQIWPQLTDTRVAYVWSGNTGYSFTHMPSVGGRDGLHHAMGYSGSGTVLAPYLGAKAAWQALGDPRGATAYSRTRLRRSWMHPVGRPHFLSAANLWYRMVVDRVENMGAARPPGR